MFMTHVGGVALAAVPGADVLVAAVVHTAVLGAAAHGGCLVRDHLPCDWRFVVVVVAVVVVDDVLSAWLMMIGTEVRAGIIPSSSFSDHSFLSPPSVTIPSSLPLL